MIAIQAWTILGLLHQRLIFCLLGLCTLTEFSWKKIRGHFLQVKWHSREWFFQVPLPFGTREVLVFISYLTMRNTYGSMEHHKNKSFWLNSIHLSASKRFSSNSLSIHCPAQGHVWCMLSPCTWVCTQLLVLVLTKQWTFHQSGKDQTLKHETVHSLFLIIFFFRENTLLVRSSP